MSSIILTGDTSGTLTVSAPLVAGSNTVTLPAATGTISLLTQATAVASTSGTSVDFTGIPSWAKRITVMFSGVSTSGTSLLLLQLGDSGGIENTGYTGVVNSALGEAASSTAGWSLFRANAATNVYRGCAILVNLSGNEWNIDSNIGNVTNNQSGFTSGSKTLSDVLTQVRITTVNGTDTFDAGSINIMYEG